MGNGEMNWTRPLLEELKHAVEGRSRHDVIHFHGQEVLVSYAQYLIEYLEGMLS